MRPAVVALDVNETLVDLEGLRPRFEAAGAPGHLLDRWFAATLRDGASLAAAGGYADFADVATANLRDLIGPEGAAHVMDGFSELDLHRDVADGLRSLADAGIRLVTLTNGSARTAARLLERGGIGELLEAHFSVADARRWKPAPEPYLLAAERCGVEAAEMTLVAVHPWDVDGARRAGFAGAWLNRGGREWPGFLDSPEISAADLPSLAAAVVRTV